MKLSQKMDMVSLATFVAMLADKPKEFRDLGTAWVKEERNMKESADAARGNAKVIGKWLYAFRKAWETTLQKEATYAGRTFRESVCVFLAIENSKNVLNRSQSCCNAFRLVDGKFIEESVYDLQPVDAITVASEILTRAKDQLFVLSDGSPDLEKTYPAIVECAKILNTPGEAAKALRALKARMVTGEDGKVSLLTPEEAKVLAETVTPLEAAESAANLNKKGHLGALMAEIEATAKTTEDATVQYEIARHLARLQLAFIANPKVGHENAKNLVGKAKAELTVQVNNTPAPAAQPEAAAK